MTTMTISRELLDELLSGPSIWAMSRMVTPINRRNGTTRKVLKGHDGAVPIDSPRDRDGSFAPELIPKGQTRIDGMDDKIIGLYAAGSTRDIRAHFEEVYGLEVSAGLVSRVTDAVLDEVSYAQKLVTAVIRRRFEVA